jgi:hypothetical protein
MSQNAVVPASWSREYGSVAVQGWQVGQVRPRGVYGEHVWPADVEFVLYVRRRTGRGGRTLEEREAPISGAVLGQLVLHGRSADMLAEYVLEHGR